MKTCADGLLIKYRSYRNYHYPASDPTVLHLPFEEIEWACGSIRSNTIPDSGRVVGQLRRRITVELKLALAGQSLEALEKALSADRERKDCVRHNHFPVRVAPESVLEIDWEVRPKMDIFLDDVGRHVSLQQAIATEIDFTSIKKLDPARQREMLARLVAQGDTFSASRLVRKLYGLDLVQATAFVGQLSGGASRGHL